MRKVKSRNFVLMVVGVLLSLLLSAVVAKTMINMVNEIETKDINKVVQTKIVTTSSEIKLSGKGNFIGSTPKINKTNILDFNIKLKDLGDNVSYFVNFCNMNDEDLIYRNLDISNVKCIDKMGIDSCDNIKFYTYLLNKNKRMYQNEIVESMSCVDLVIDVEYISDVSKEVNVFIDKISLDLAIK